MSLPSKWTEFGYNSVLLAYIYNSVFDYCDSEPSLQHMLP